MIAGRKLLLADDSAAVQKVVELTFTDEGMEVFTVGDGDAAWEKLAHVTPDVVLADAFMPGLSGYELCRSIKDDNRLAQIPVMLLISSFAPFDEAEAQRVGADDIMTKPFQSIRQLVSRVDSLVSGRPMPAILPDQPAPELNTESETELTPVYVEQSEPHVTVLVEAAQLETAQPEAEPSGTCAPDIEFQTADTARLEPASDDSADTIEIEPPSEPAEDRLSHETRADQSFENTETRMTEFTPNQPIQSPGSDSLLDLDDADFARSASGDEVILDLDLDESPTAVHEHASWDFAPVLEPRARESVVTPVDAARVSDELTVEPSAIETAPLVEPHTAESVDEISRQALGQSELSPQAIEAIARRVIEQLSDKVVREIAWEVVPELSELMIRKKLDQR